MRKPTRSEEVRRRVSAPVSPDTTVDLADSACCETLVLIPDDSILLHPHRLEQDVRNRLMAEPSLHFTSLVVRASATDCVWKECWRPMTQTT